MEFIRVHRAMENNLKGVDLTLPKGKMVVFTGVSGSGKSTMAIDVIYAEGQRRYLESLSSYARQFLGGVKRPNVEGIEGLSPAIAINQKTTSHNPRSTVGTVTEIYDYLRLLFARVGTAYCPKCGDKLEAQSIDEIVDTIVRIGEEAIIGDKVARRYGFRFMVSAVVVEGKKGSYVELFNQLLKQGFNRARIDGVFYDLTEKVQIDKNKRHTIEVIVGSFTIKNKVTDESRREIFRLIEQALKLQKDFVRILEIRDKDTHRGMPQYVIVHDFSTRRVCKKCGISLPEFEPRHFSFNSPAGACTECNGLGYFKQVVVDRIVNKNLSIIEGAIEPINLLGGDAFFDLLNQVSHRHGFTLNTPLFKLSQDQLNVVLYGDGRKYPWGNKLSNMYSKSVVWHGIVGMLEKRYKSTTSEAIRREIDRYMADVQCPACKGARLNGEVLAVRIGRYNIADVTNMSISKFQKWIRSINKILNSLQQKIAEPIVEEIYKRCSFLVDVGLSYLTLSRSATTLSGGEAQRIRLASQVGTGLTGVIYVLDEPSIGLHARDQKKLVNTLKKLSRLGNTVIVVEHDRDTIESADYVVDFGPMAGSKGGKVVFTGTIKQLKESNTITGRYLSDRDLVYRRVNDKFGDRNVRSSRVRQLEITGVTTNNLKNINVKIPLNKFVCVTGVSGSGKSSLLVETIYPALLLQTSRVMPKKIGKFKNISGYQYIKRVVFIDQSPIGRTPRSNPATYTKVFDSIREIFAMTKEAKRLGYTKSKFSFNLKGGRCEACRGEGKVKIEMMFMPDVYVDCEVCGGKRYTSEVLRIKYKGKSIADVLDMTVDEAYEFFENVPQVAEKLQMLKDVGLGYIKLGQPAPELSGGESQRIKLAAELGRRGLRTRGDVFYILDEPTTGLHFADIEKLLIVLKRLVCSGNTVVAIEHNLDFIRMADWIIDLGPEGGDKGGEVVFTGTVKDITNCSLSWTGKMLKEYLK